MTAYIIRRLLYTIPIVFGVALIVFTLFNLVGGDPVLLMVGKHASAQTIAELRAELGLDRSLFLQFVDYLKQIVTFDFGRSYSTRQEISDMIARGIAPSMSLAIPAFLATLTLSVSTSLFVAYFRGKTIDKVVVVLCVAGMSIPALAFILFGQHWLAYKAGLFPISGYSTDWVGRWQYLVLPIIIWMTVSLGVDVRYFRTAILDETYQDYVRTARAKGLREKWVFFKHILKNSLVPIITYLVIQIPFLILGSLLLENFFGIPGIGSMLINAINTSDFPVLKALVTISSLMYIAGTLLTDILYKVVDPRVTFK